METSPGLGATPWHRAQLPHGETPSGLRRANFRCLARNGFGDSRNSYAHCMNWFRGRLYVGTTRNLFQLVNIAPDPSTDAFHLWPVHVPYGLDASKMEQNCQIWSCDPFVGEWEKVFESPRVPSLDGSTQVWRDFGYRNMVVHQTDGDDAPALYVSTMSSSKSPGAMILRSTDGETFEPASEPGIGDRRVSSFRAVVGLNGRLFAAPAGAGRMWASALSASVVLECRDPRKRQWIPVSEPDFGDPTNAGIFEMATFNGCVYAGVANPYTGIQVWKTDLSGNPPYSWKKVLTHGAGRGKLNQAVMSMFASHGALYVGTGIRRGGYDREYQTGPAAGELIRILPDDSWQLVMGQERRMAGGDVQPLSGLGPGFGNPFNGYIWCMAEHEGSLYVGTYDSSIFMWWIDPNRVPRGRNPRLRLLGAQRIVDAEGGFDLWRSPDGIRWFEVSRNGFGNPYNYGVRTLHGRDCGLFVGTANPFGPDVAVRTVTGWAYAPNPNGGAEVWMGSREIAADTQNLSGPAYVRQSGDAEQPSAPRESAPGSVNVHYDHAMYEHPLLGHREYFSFSHYSNYGYWDAGTANQKEACDNLLERLVAFVPHPQGRVLDVACGLGETTRYLGRIFGPSNVTGVNISEKQIATCRRVAPGSRFLVMDATQLDFDDASMDVVVCVEAAFHFRTRERFLREAFRVLRPGGRLVLSDMLFTKEAESKSPVLHARNFVPNTEEYARRLQSAGFEEPCVVDATQECFIRCNDHFLRYATDRYLDEAIDARTFRGIMAYRLALLMCVRTYILAGARKPSLGDDADGAGRPNGHIPAWLETHMNTDETKEREKAVRARRSAKAHWLISSLTQNQARLHRELAMLLDKEGEAHAVLDRWAREGAARQTKAEEGDAMLGWAREHVKQRAIAQEEAMAHRDLASRSDARTLWHKTASVLLMRAGVPGAQVPVSPPPKPARGRRRS